MRKLLLVFFLSLCIQLFTNHNAIAQGYSPSWVNDIAGGGGSVASAVVADKGGNIYITGRFAGTAVFNLKQGGTQTLNSNGGADIFIAKYDPVAGNYIWAIGFGGDSDEHPTGMALDNSGNVIIIGQYQSSSINFNPKGNATVSPQGAEDVFFAKYDANGNYVWAKSIGESGTDRGTSVATDGNNNIFITGIFENTMNADPNGGNYPLVSNNGNYCQFFGKYDSTGKLVWAHALPGGLSASPGNPIKVDPISGNVVIGGDIINPFDFSYGKSTNGTITPTSQSNYLAEYSNDGTYKWAKYLRSETGTGKCVTILITSGSNIILDASFTGTFYPDPTIASLTAKGTNDICLIQYTSTGSPVWVDQLGGNGASTYGNDICLDNNQNIVAAGSFSGSIDFGAGSPNSILTSQGGEYFYISKYNSNGKSLIQSAFGGTCGSNVIYRVVANSAGVYVAGGFCGTVDFDPSTCKTDNLTASAVPDALVAKYVIATDSLSVQNTISDPADSVFCTSGDPGSIIGSMPSGGSTYNYQWQSSTDKVTFANITGATAKDYDPTLITVTTYYRRVVSAGSCGASNSNIITISILSPPLPPASFTQAVCIGNTATLSLTGVSQGPNIYNWYTSAARSTLLFTGTTYVTGAINENTTYYVEAVNGGCSSTTLATVQVNVNPLTAAPSVANTTLQTCSDSQVTLNITNPQNGYSYVWYAAATGGIPIFTGTTFVVSSPTATISYYAEAVSNSGCTSAARTEVDITVIPLPSPPQVETPLALCSGSPATLTVSDPQADLTYKWYNVATGGTPLITGTQYNTPLLTANATYYVEATSNTGGCISAARTQVTVIVTPLPAAPASIVQQTCTGSQATLTIADPQNSITYNWYDSAAKTNLLYSGVSYTTGFINTNTTFYIEAVNGTCPATSLATAQVNVIPLPAAPAVIGNVIPTCYGTQVTFNINNPQQGFTYNWYTTGTGGNPVFTGTSFTTPTLTANTTYYAEAVNSNSCASSRTAVNAVIIPTADVTAQGTAICPGTSATLTATSQNPDATFDWYDAATGGTKLFSGSSFTTPALTANTTYYAQVMNAAGCVVSTRAKAVVTILTQLATPVVTVGSTSPTSITFDWTAVPSALGYLVSIDGGATYTTPSSGSSGTEQIISNLQLGQSVTILVEATGVSECQLSGSSTAVTAIAQYPQNDIVYIPNAFTPNGDGKNDVVFVHGNNIRSLTFSIYDQWGELIFRSLNQTVGWDGTFKGSRQPVGVYVYYVQAILNTGTNVNKKGTITLLR